ncbi:MAG: DNA-3-methyladenine glycosylase 2 family protein [Rhodospirillaceae bacterium]|nr:DNA-3-methyladenine glycosylase 2 family protein [Rhodospirillaceae bacterium]
MSSTATVHRHLRILKRRDPHIARGTAEAGLPRARRWEPGYGTLVRIIIDQQVSTAAGRAIWAKLERAAGGAVTSAAVAALTEPALRAAGLSSQKARYIQGLTDAVETGTLDLAAVNRADDDTVRERLTALKGIGPWSADIYLMFGLGRPDIWPVGDLGLQHGARLLLNLRTRPNPKRLDRLGESWRPYRSSAALFLWHYYGFRTAR